MEQGLANFSIKSQMVNILSFPGSAVSAATIQLCNYSTKAVTDNKLMNSCSCMYNINLTYGHTFKFHVIFMCHKILSFFYFQPSKSILISRTREK